MQQTIKTVRDRARVWKNKPEFSSVEGTFEDGSAWQSNCKTENAESRIETLKALIGYPGDFTLEARDDYNGQKQWNMKSYPGKTLFGGGGGSASSQGNTPSPPPSRGGFQVRFRDTPEGFAMEQRSIHRSVALEHAVVAVKGAAVQNIIGEALPIANAFYQWLSQDTPPAAARVASTDNGQAAGGGILGLTTGDKIQTAMERYVSEINAAIKVSDHGRLDKLQTMIAGSLDKNSISIDEASELDAMLQRGKKVIGSAILHAAWVKEKQAEASAREPMDAKQKFLEEAGERF